MAFVRKLGVNRRDSLCGVLLYASAESLDFLDLTKKFSFLIWKPLVCIFLFMDKH
jgi:hypothetical protein